jgi:hypothetical protein
MDPDDLIRIRIRIRIQHFSSIRIWIQVKTHYRSPSVYGRKFRFFVTLVTPKPLAGIHFCFFLVKGNTHGYLSLKFQSPKCFYCNVTIETVKAYVFSLGSMGKAPKKILKWKNYKFYYFPTFVMYFWWFWYIMNTSTISTYIWVN